MPLPWNYAWLEVKTLNRTSFPGHSCNKCSFEGMITIERLSPFFVFFSNFAGVKDSLLKHRLLPWPLLRFAANSEKIRTFLSFNLSLNMITWWRKEFQKFVRLATTHRHYEGPESSPVLATNCHLCCKKHPILYFVARKTVKSSTTHRPKSQNVRKSRLSQ